MNQKCVTNADMGIELSFCSRLTISAVVRLCLALFQDDLPFAGFHWLEKTKDKN